MLNDTIVEIWRSQLGSTPPEGAQIAELNGMGFGTLYQDVATTPGQVLRWSLVHRGRDGTDSMRVDIGAVAGPATTQEQWSTSNAAFVRHSGVYTVPAGQTTTRLSLVPVATYNNNLSIGNLIDDVSFVSAPCLGAATTITNITRGGTSYYPGDVVEYITTVTNSGSSPAVGSVFTTVIPATLAYQAGSLQVAGVARTDASGDDVAEYVGGTQTVTARLGTGATTTAGGSLAADASMTVRYRATVQTAAAGGTLVHTSSTAYADSLAPSWPLSAVSPTITTPVIAVADLATTVVSSPVLGAAIRGTQATWQFRITNNGPATASGVSASVALTGTFTAAASVQYNVSGTWLNCTTTGTPRTCTIGALASGATVDIRIQGTVPAAQANGSTYSMTTTASTTSSDTTAGNNAATSSGTLDIVAPTTPGTPTTSAPSGTGVTLSWTASTDAVGVTGYRIFANGSQIATSATNSVPITGLTAGQPYYFWVQAVDAAGNVSAASGGTPFITTLGTGRYLVNYVNGGLCVGAVSDLEDAQVQTLTCNSASHEPALAVRGLRRRLHRLAAERREPRLARHDEQHDRRNQDLRGRVGRQPQDLDAVRRLGCRRPAGVPGHPAHRRHDPVLRRQRRVDDRRRSAAAVDLQRLRCPTFPTDGGAVMTRQRLTRTAVSLVLAAVSAVALSVLPAASAQAAPPEVLVSTDGYNFSPSLTAGVFDGFGALVPGDSISATLWVMNDSADPGLVRVSVSDLLVPSIEFGTGVILTSNDGQQLRTASLGELAVCSVIVPSVSVPPGGVVRINLAVRMLDLNGLTAQGQTANLDFAVAMRDAAGGAFPNVSGCPAFAAPSGPLAFTGAQSVLPIAAFALALVAGGLVLILRRRRDEETEKMTTTLAPMSISELPPPQQATPAPERKPDAQARRPGQEPLALPSGLDQRGAADPHARARGRRDRRPGS